MKRIHCIVLLLIGFGLSKTAFPQTANPGQYKYVFTVAKDGSGDYKYIQDAIDAMRVYPLSPITLYIKNGVYNEKIELPATNTDVTFIGESVDKTIISFNDYSGRGKLTTFTSFTAKISGNRFRAENISFVNTAGPVGQALALYVDADKALFKNCKFLGNQDTIFASGETARQLFIGCYIEGTPILFSVRPPPFFSSVPSGPKPTRTLPLPVPRPAKNTDSCFSTAASSPIHP